MRLAAFQANFELFHTLVDKNDTISELVATCNSQPKDQSLSYIPPEAFLNEEFPRKYQALLPGTIKLAYEAAESLARDNPILQVGSVQHGRLRSWATDRAIERLIKTGQLPFDYDWHDYAKPTGKYLRVRLESSIMSVSLVSNCSKPPRKVEYRSNNALGNSQAELFPETVEEQKITGLPYFLLVHGHKNPDFAHIGMPAPDSKTWAHISPNLMQLPHENLTKDVPPVKAVDTEAVLSFKEDLAKWQHDQK